MEFHLLVILVCLVGVHSAKLKESPKSGADTEEPSQKSAIIAIQIVDPEEQTGGKNSKRTIDSSLGYGYRNSIFGGKVSPPKYEVYKYSQHDIPPYSVPGFKNTETKKSGYHGKSSYQHSAASTQPSYKSGTTLFSTINHQGQVGGLSSHPPSSLGGQESLAVPIIILRVLPSQLTAPSSHLYPNLPQSNFFAPIVNTIDIKSLLSKYLSNIDTSPAYSAPQYQPEVPQQSSHYQQQQSYDSYQPKQTAVYQQVPQEKPVEIVRSQERQTIQQIEYPTQQALPLQYQQNQHQSQPVQQSYYQQGQYLPANPNKGDDLLTHENYPSKDHTRVIFKTSEGQIRTSNKATHDSAQQNYAQEPAQNLDYNQYGDQNADYQDANVDYAGQEPDLHQYQADPNQYQSDPNQYNADPNQYQPDSSQYQPDSNQYQSDSGQYLYENQQAGQHGAASAQNVIYVPAESQEEDES